MALETPIEPTPISLPAVNASVEHIVINFKGGQYATARICLTDVNGLVVGAFDVPFTSEELAEWGEDDVFVLNAAMAKLEIAA